MSNCRLFSHASLSRVRFLRGESLLGASSGPGEANAGAEFGQATAFTAGATGQAGATAVLDEPVADGNPVLTRYHLDQISLSLHRVSRFGQAQPPGNSSYVRVDNHALSQTESTAEHDVGCLAADSRQAHQLGEGGRDDATKTVN